MCCAGWQCPCAVCVCVIGGTLVGDEPQFVPQGLCGALQFLHCLKLILSRGELCLLSLFVPWSLSWIAGLFIPYKNKHFAFVKEVAALFIEW